MDHCCNNIRIIICHHFETYGFQNCFQTPLLVRKSHITGEILQCKMEGFFSSKGQERNILSLKYFCWKRKFQPFLNYKYNTRNIFPSTVFIRCATRKCIIQLTSLSLVRMSFPFLPTWTFISCSSFKYVAHQSDGSLRDRFVFEINYVAIKPSDLLHLCTAKYWQPSF